MPRADKPINPGSRLDAPVSASRGHGWTKHGGPETVDGFRGAPVSGDPGSTEVTVDDITIVTTEALEAASKWDQRGTSAHVPPGVTGEIQPVVRSVDGRVYRRRDDASFVEVEL
jgi:hypothetical protein